MTTTECKDLLRELVSLNKQLLKQDKVGRSANAIAYSKYLQRALRDARTFDKSSATYVDYAAKSLAQRKKSAETKAARQKQAAADEQAAPAKSAKRKEPPVDLATTKSGKSTKKKKSKTHDSADAQ